MIDTWTVKVESVNTTAKTVNSFICHNKPLIPSSVRCSSQNTRIVNGNPAQAYSWPWIVHFDKVGCGGSIIDQSSKKKII